MINDDLESNIMQEDRQESTSEKFPLKKVYLPKNIQGDIIAMSCSRKFIYLVSDRSELFRLESTTLNPIVQAYTIRPSDNHITKAFKERLTKIWTDRAGNHSIIRYGNNIYYFNGSRSIVKELVCFREKEICAVAFDEMNTNEKSTGNILLADYNNNIYEYNLTVEFEGAGGDYSIKNNLQQLITLSFKDSDDDGDDEVIRNIQPDRIYGIKFFRSPKKNLDNNEDTCYIIMVTRTRFYQFIGPGVNSFKQIFGRFERNSSLFNDNCKYFPDVLKKKLIFTDTNLDILYKAEQRNLGNNTSERIELYNHFGWKTESGYCFGSFSYGGGNIPKEVKNFVVTPFVKITENGEKKEGNPISIVHSVNHIFVLYDDCLTVISKLTSNIIDTQYFREAGYTNMIYDEYFPGNGTLLLSSKKTLTQILLKDEDKDIWQDYLEIGEFSKAINLCSSENPDLVRKINKIGAEDCLEHGDGRNSAVYYSSSDEKFETVCLKFLLKDDIVNLKLYLEMYAEQNLDKKKDLTQLTLINTWLFEIYLNETSSKKNRQVEDFKSFVRDKKKYLDKETIYQLLQSYGRMEEFVEFASLMEDYEAAVLHYINEKNYQEAIGKLEWFSSFSDDEDILRRLCSIFLLNSHVFFKHCPKESICLLQQRFQRFVDMENIVQAIMSTTDKDIIENSSSRISTGMNEKELEKETIKKKNNREILLYLKSLVEGPSIKKEENNIHNLYIYYLSKSEENQQALIEYLKKPLMIDDDNYGYYTQKKEALFQLDYAKKLFYNNKPAYALVLALMGKYTQGVRTALQAGESCHDIAKFIAANAPSDKLRKKLWIDIFSVGSQKEFAKALDVMKESKILKIEDVLPHITDTIKIEEFKKQISECINEYEKNIKKLKDDITEYNKTAENIKGDIIKVKKKSMEIQYSSCKCELCQGYIKDKNIYLFPCGHMFDAKCIKDCLKNYEETGVNEENITKKNKRIEELFVILGLSEENPIEEKNEDVIDTKKKQEDSGFFSKIINIGGGIKEGFKRPDASASKLSEKQLQEAREELNSILSEQCVLCGDYMVESIQCSLSNKKRELNKWSII